MKTKKLIKAMRKIRKYCSEKPVCRDCILHTRNGCGLKRCSEEWEEERKKT